MAIRISGMVSGLDTESLVSDLVSAYSTKKDNYVKAQTKLSWKQDAWKNLNKKVYSLYSGISSLRFSSAYSLKKATSSDTTKASVKATGDAINGTQKLVVKELAATGYLTGGELHRADGSGKAANNTKLSELKGNGFGLEAGQTGTINVNGKEVSLSGDDTIAATVNKLKDAGVSASFDEKNQRIFVSSKDSGTENEFTLTASNENGAKALQSLGLMASSKSASTAYKALLDQYAAKDGEGNYSVNSEAIRSALESGSLTASSYGDKDYQTAVKTYSYAKAAKEGTDGTLRTDYETYLANQKKLDDLKNAGFNKAVYDGLKKADDTALNNVYMTKDGSQLSVEDGKILKDGKEVGARDGYVLDGNTITYTDGEGKQTTYTKSSELLSEMERALTATFGGTAEEAYQALNDTQKAADEFKGSYGGDLDVLANVYGDRANLDDLMSSSLDTAAAKFKEKVQNAITASGGSGVYQASQGAVRVDAADAEIELNGATFKGSTNSFSINGLLIDVTGKTDSNGITLTTSTDNQGIYDKVKDFLSQYNDVMNEMCSLYNAASAKGYEPLTSEEKSALSDNQVEEWEAKVKSALLRRDSTLDSLISSMSSSMQKNYIMGKNSTGSNVQFTLNKDGSYAGSDGKTYTMGERTNGKYSFTAEDGSTISASAYSWSSFGIGTLGILNSPQNEYNAYHIDGDADDTLTSGNKDKLMEAITRDPDAVIDFLKNATSSLYDSINKKMAGTSLRSAYTVYNDKEMNKEYSDYTDTIKKWEDKVSSIEDSYYKKFAAMEKALASIQGQSSALGGLF